MKFRNRIIALLALTPMFFITSCDDGDAVVDDVTANVERGAILRTVDLISGELALGNPDANFAIELEVQDEENGALVDQVDVFVGFRDNTDQTGPGTDVDESLFGSINKSEFTIGSFGLPRLMFSAPLADLLAAVGRTEADIDGGDQFTIRFELVLNDGRKFSFAQNSGTLTGSFFSSPFLYTPNVVCFVPDGAFQGTYDLALDNPGVFSGGVFAEGNVEISAPGTTSREIAVTAYPQFGGFARTFRFDLICDDVVIVEVDTGLACVTGEASIVWRSSTAIATYDLNDDSVIQVAFTEDGGSCGAPVDVTFTLTKQ